MSPKNTGRSKIYLTKDDVETQVTNSSRLSNAVLVEDIENWAAKEGYDLNKIENSKSGLSSDHQLNVLK